MKWKCMFFIFSDNDLQIQVAKVFNNTDDFFFFKKNPIVQVFYVCACLDQCRNWKIYYVDNLTSLSLLS